MKLKSKVGMARGPVVDRQKQSFRVLRQNWNAVLLLLILLLLYLLLILFLNAYNT